MHLTFDTSTVDIAQGTNAATTLSGQVGVGYGYTKFSAVIRLNGWYLRNATNEYNLSTIVHEVMHAIFKLRWGQYQIWLNNHVGGIDSNWMKSHFPIYWTRHLQNMQIGLLPPNVNDHQIMGTDYQQFFTTLIRPFYNHSATTSIKDTVLKALGWAGLRETTAWKLLGTNGVDTCKYKNLNASASGARIGTFQSQGCAPFTTHYSDSLKLSPPCN